MNKQARIREELQEAEAKANFYAREVQAAEHATWYCTVKNRYVHFQMRRQFYLKLLLKTQLKEFDHG